MIVFVFFGVHVFVSFIIYTNDLEQNKMHAPGNSLSIRSLLYMGVGWKERQRERERERERERDRTHRSLQLSPALRRLRSSPRVRVLGS